MSPGRFTRSSDRAEPGDDFAVAVADPIEAPVLPPTPEPPLRDAVEPVETMEAEEPGRLDRAINRIPFLTRSRLFLFSVLALATFVRLWQINALGYNSDEAVYGGQGASIANDPTLEPFFPTFRAHPLLFQTLLSVGYHLNIGEIFGRVAAAAIGVLTVYFVFKLGKLLYGERAGLIAALFMALMPYHVVVTRQVLLDGPMVLCATITLYLVARFVVTRRPSWLYAAGAFMGLTMMGKESSIVLLGAIYAFLALRPEVRARVRDLVIAGSLTAAVFILFPLSLSLAGKADTGGNYLAWQLFRRPNHDLSFYPTEVPLALGLLVVAAAVVGLLLLRRYSSWKETLLLAWIAVPVAFFELWPVKGFQYLLPIAPAVAILAARGLAHSPRWDYRREDGTRPRVVQRLRAAAARPHVIGVAVGVIALSLFIPTWSKITPSDSDTFLAGSGGVPGGRETGAWMKANVPEGARVLTLGPSMANIIQYYGQRKSYGLSVSPNPLNRNPSYEPLPNPDKLIRENELQYVVWDAFSAERSRFFSRNLLRYVDRYHGRAVHSETVPSTTAGGKKVEKPIITVYEVRP